MSSKPAFFVIPGDIATISGGYGYDRRLIEGLRSMGKNVNLVSLGSSFPKPTPEDALDAAEKLAGLPSECIAVIDGLALGALDPKVLSKIRAPLVALIHHPLAFEGGLSPDTREHLLQNERENLKLASRVIVTSPSTAKLLAGQYGVPENLITIASPGIEAQKNSGDRVLPPLILSVGIQIPRKGHDVLLIALAKIGHLPWQAVIAGPVSDKAYGKKLVGMIDELGLSHRVELAGEVSSRELSRLYSEASIFALATRFEGYGMVFGEAMASGLPIVSCVTGAVSDTVPGDAGILVQPDNPELFAEALVSILQDESLRANLSSASAAAGAKLTSWEKSSVLVSEVLDELAAVNSKRPDFL
jgi:glycosyltransferase involved in cell wall biosynthesis